MLPIILLPLKIWTMLSVFSMRRNSFHTRKVWLEVYNLFLEEETNLQIWLHHNVFLKTLRVMDVHQLVHHLLSSTLPTNQSPNDSEVFPCIVLSHHLTDCRMYHYIKLKEQVKGAWMRSTYLHFHMQKPHQYFNLEAFE